VTAITITNIDNAMRLRLQARAAKHGHSIEAEARDILHAVLNEDEVTSSSLNLYEAIRSLVEPLGGMDLVIPPRQPVRQPPLFE
jgi:plasmid stability protein